MEQNTILVVDDDKEGLKMLNYYLGNSPQKYQVLSASNGAIALDILQQKIPELIITDWEMPILNGVELIQRIKLSQATAHLPVIIITGVNTTAQNLKQAFDIGADDFLTKPFNQLELFARVNAALKMYRALRTIQKQREIIEDQKNRELSSRTLEVTQKQQLLSSIRKRVNKVGYQLRGDLKTELRSIEKEIDHNLKTVDEWKTFKLYFENIHPHFFDHLLQKCPTLSQADLRHCAYLKIGLNNNEIANLFSISPPSVITQHYRIKKKIGIEGSQKLVEFVHRVA